MAREHIEAVVLDSMIAEMVSRLADCRHCHVGSVVMQPLDGKGCNWKISRVSGQHCLECLQAMGATLSDLQNRYVLAEPNDAASLLTTWALPR